jgi:hypothetical protein
LDDLKLETIDEPPPIEPDCKGEPRVQYARRVHVLPSKATKEQWLHVAGVAFEAGLQTVGFSYDDAGIGALDSKTAILWGLHPSQHETFTTWYSEEYPGTLVQFRDFNQANHEIVDVVDDLTTHATKEYNTRALDSIHRVIVHHTTGNPHGSTEAIANYHVNSRDWPGIGYHYLIDGSGVIEQVNRHETMSYHASYNNDDSIGVSLKGSFVGDVQPSDEQLDAAAWLIAKLKAELPIDDVIGHKETDWAQQPGNATQCPGDTWELWKGRIV